MSRPPNSPIRPIRQCPPVSVYGAPTDVGAGTRGVSMGPEALRVAGLVESLQARGVDVLDRGDLAGPRNPWQPPTDGHRHLDEVVAWNRAVLESSAAELAAGRMPVLLGGDHSLAVGSITAVAHHCREVGKRLRVLWLDAHAASIPRTSPLPATSTACRWPACAGSGRAA
jgi:arginase